MKSIISEYTITYGLSPIPTMAKDRPDVLDFPNLDTFEVVFEDGSSMRVKGKMAMKAAKLIFDEYGQPEMMKEAGW